MASSSCPAPPDRRKLRCVGQKLQSVPPTTKHGAAPVEEPTSTQAMIYWRKLLHTGQDTHTYRDPLVHPVTNTEPHFVMLDGQTVKTSGRQALNSIAVGLAVR